MKNISSIISSHNKKLLNTKNEDYGCNCRGEANKLNCPLQNVCKTPKVIYMAEVSNDTDDEKRKYIGLTERSFKERYNNHTSSFSNRKYQKSTELSKYIWLLKDANKIPTIQWRILKSINCDLNSKQCILCLYEKLYIINNIDDSDLLNKRTEFVSKCRHQNKHMLEKCKSDSND